MKQKEKDPAFLMYSEKFLAGTYFMTDEQVGKYIRLLCLQHQKGHLTEEQLAKIITDEDTELADKFVEDEDGKFYNVRLDMVIIERAEFAERQRINGQKGGRPPKANNNPNHNPNYYPDDNPDESTRNKDEDKGKEAKSIIETNSPSHLFKQEEVVPSHDSLEDLYNDLN